MDEAKKSSRCWRYSKNFCVVMAGAAAICNVVVGTYLYYSVDFQDVVRRIDGALDAYGEFLPTAERSIQQFNEILKTLNATVGGLRESVNRVPDPPTLPTFP